MTLLPQSFRCVFLIAALLVNAIATNAMAQDTAKPNVVVIFVDDMGFADPSCFGNPAMKTPQIDRLAAEGLKLTNFYVNSPICSASRVALTTGQYQQRFRIHSYFAGRKSNRDRKMPDWLNPRAPTLAKILKNNGYHTAHFGKWHMGGGRDVDDAPLPQQYGFDESLVSFEGLGDRILFHENNDSWFHGRGNVEGVEKHETSKRYVDRAIDFIERNKDEPFYVRFFPNDVHDAHLPSEDQLAKWKGSSDNPPDEKFFAVLEALDQQIGRILDTLDRLALTDNTLVMFTSDNGPTDWPSYYRKNTTPPGFTGPLFGRKWSLYEGGIRMPFIVRWPGKIPAGKTDDESLMCAIDWLPTAAKLTGCDLSDSNFDGEDRSSVLLGTASKRSAPIFWEYGVHGSIKPGKVEHRSPQLAVRDGDWKLLCNPDGSETKLFNLRSDIGEKNNLADAQADKAATLKGSLLAWWQEMDKNYDDLDASPVVTKDNVEFVIGPRYADATEFFARRNVPRGTVHRFTMKSEDSKIYPGIAKRKRGVVPYERNVVLYVPPKYQPGTAAPFIIAQDGNWYTSMTRVLDNMIHDKRIPPLVAIMIDSGGGDSKGSQRGLEYDTVSGLYAEFVETEVLPKISKDFNIAFTSDPNGRATMGGSSGGAAAFSMAWFRPDLYHRVLSYSGTFVDQQWPENPETPDGAWEYHKRLIAESPKKPLRIWLHVSEFDNGHRLNEASLHNWVMANERMAAELKKKGYEYRYVFAKDARHIDSRVTKQTLPGALEWLWQGYPIAVE